MKSILVVIGSAIEDGNTYKLADAFIKGLQEGGHNVKKVFLGNKEINGCRGCDACQNNNICVIRDDMQDIYPMFEKCDTVVLASPLYFWTISARTKAFIERLYATSVNDEFPHKDTILLMTAGDDNFWTFEQPISHYRFLTKAIGWTDKGICVAGGCESKQGKRYIDNANLDKAYEMGKKLT